jgi:hypothetical protein
MAERQVRPLYQTREDPDADFDGVVADEAVIARAWTALREEAEYTDRYVLSAPDLDTPSVPDDVRGPLSLRLVLVHIIEEYARHLGHADLLRQRVDGRVGQ